ncbi:MAG: carbohydrate deacetylase [Oceanipulchritudo sp.]
MKKLLTRADDFGASPGTNTAILEAARAGLVRNVGVMAPGPWLEHHLENLLAMRELICVGLHATLNSEWAGLRWGPMAGAASVPGLVRADGTFHEKVEHTHRFADPEEGVGEIRAQLEHLRSLGLEPEYLDCHMVFNWHPDWDRALGELAIAEGLVYHAHGMLPALHLRISKAFRPGPEDVLQFMKRENVDRAAWVFHPARRDAVSDQFRTDPDMPATRVAETRHLEYRFLTDSRSVQSFLDCREIELIRYDQLSNMPVLQPRQVLQQK